jgi:hypothetical protein
MKKLQKSLLMALGPKRLVDADSPSADVAGLANLVELLGSCRVIQS